MCAVGSAANELWAIGCIQCSDCNISYNVSCILLPLPQNLKQSCDLRCGNMLQCWRLMGRVLLLVFFCFVLAFAPIRNDDCRAKALAVPVSKICQMIDVRNMQTAQTTVDCVEDCKTKNAISELVRQKCKVYLQLFALFLWS